MEGRPGIPPLDGVRGVAALLVVASHIGLRGEVDLLAGAGQLGVLLFFVLSGFLMSYLYIGDKALGIRHWIIFAIRRVFRVYPLYLFIVTACFVTTELGTDWLFRMDLDAFIRHIFLQAGISVLWTIPVEMKFYAVFPLLAVGLVRVRDRRFRCAALLALIGFFTALPPVAGKLSLLRYVEVFFYGLLTAEIYLGAKDFVEARPRRRSPVAAGLAGMAFLALIALIPGVSTALTGEEIGVWRQSYLAAPVASTFILAAALSSGASRWLLANPLSRRVGQISYSLYLVHAPLVKHVMELHALSIGARVALSLGVSTLAATALYLGVERPCRRWGVQLAAAPAVRGG